MHIGLLQTGHLPDDFQAEFGDYPELYGRLLNPVGLTLTPYPVVDDVFPKSPTEQTGWLISGSRHGVYDDLDWIPKLEGFIRKTYAAGVPIVGICFGHQIIAQALGGHAQKFDGGWTVGRHAYDWNGREVLLNAWHQDQVIVPPDGATTIAGSPGCKYAALKYGERALTIQAHPEFSAGETGKLLATRAPGVVPDDRIRAAEAELGKPTDDERIAAEIATFFRSAGEAHDRVA